MDGELYWETVIEYIWKFCWLKEWIWRVFWFWFCFFLELKAWILRGKTSRESFTSRIPGNRKNTSDSCGRAEEDLSPEGHRQNGIHLIQEAQEQREMGPEGQSSNFHSENLSTTRWKVINTLKCAGKQFITHKLSEEMWNNIFYFLKNVNPKKVSVEPGSGGAHL